MILQEYLTSVREQLAKQNEATLRVKVSPGAAQTKWHSLLESDFPQAKIRIAAAPERGKANSAITKFIQKEFNCTAEITSGFTNSSKTIKLTK